MKEPELTDCVWINEKLHVALLRKYKIRNYDDEPSKFVKIFKRITSLLGQRKGGR